LARFWIRFGCAARRGGGSGLIAATGKDLGAQPLFWFSVLGGGRFVAMRASLVSATSLVALLAFEVGIDAGLNVPAANAQPFAASQAAFSFGYMLFNTRDGATATVGETVTRQTATRNAITLPSITTSLFSGLQNTTTLSTHGATATATYGFSRTAAGVSPAEIIISGSQMGTASVKPTGLAVTPVRRTTVSAFGAMRTGTTATIAAITVSPTGDDDRASQSASLAQLQGSLGVASSSVFTGSGGSSSLNDRDYGRGGPTDAAFTNHYAPMTLTTSDSATIIASSTDGGSAGTNAASASLADPTIGSAALLPRGTSQFSVLSFSTSVLPAQSANATATVTIGFSDAPGGPDSSDLLIATDRGALLFNSAVESLVSDSLRGF
jgi:hypothetical protein